MILFLVLLLVVLPLALELLPAIGLGMLWLLRTVLTYAALPLLLWFAFYVNSKG